MSDSYVSPLSGRYASTAMKALFSPRQTARQWRRLWLWLAEAQKDLGLPITDEQIEELRAHLDDIDLDDVRTRESELRHDVMAHVHSYGALCKKAKPILHWGATSAFIQDNADLILIRDGLALVRRGVANALDALAVFSKEHRALPTLGYTHFQSAQPVTVGKRASLWAQDFLLDLLDLEQLLETLPFRGAKGTTGTQASFLTLFDGDHEKVRELDRLVTQKAGFNRSIGVAGQTITRKVDARVAGVLSGIAQSASKFGNDIRLLQHLGEIEEPFAKQQIGSSAMPYKRNPMRCERICALGRFVLAASANPGYTAATQWLERTLDDSANRRLALPQLFLGADAILQLVIDVARGLVVHEGVVAMNLRRELPFLMTETLLMEAVKAGGDRQELHELIRVHARAVADQVKLGGKNDLLDRLRKEPAFAPVRRLLAAEPDPAQYTGRAAEQVDEFLEDQVAPVLDARADLLGGDAEVSV